jgi:hypothetical protein
MNKELEKDCNETNKDLISVLRIFQSIKIEILKKKQETRKEIFQGEQKWKTY